MQARSTNRPCNSVPVRNTCPAAWTASRMLRFRRSTSASAGGAVAGRYRKQVTLSGPAETSSKSSASRSRCCNARASRDVVRDQPAISRQPDVPQHDPQFERLESAALLDAELREPRQRGIVAQVGRHERKSIPHRLTILHQRASTLDRHVHPLVRVDGDAIGLFQAAVEIGQLRDERRRPSVRGVDVEPELLVPGRARRCGRAGRSRRC